MLLNPLKKKMRFILQFGISFIAFYVKRANMWMDLNISPLVTLILGKFIAPTHLSFIQITKITVTMILNSHLELKDLSFRQITKIMVTMVP